MCMNLCGSLNILADLLLQSPWSSSLGIGLLFGVLLIGHKSKLLFRNKDTELGSLASHSRLKQQWCNLGQAVEGTVPPCLHLTRRVIRQLPQEVVWLCLTRVSVKTEPESRYWSADGLFCAIIPVSSCVEGVEQEKRKTNQSLCFVLFLFLMPGIDTA